ncbi:hypothetical protein Syun_016585 [Stephania yunnanensis]|uniref:Uncharacterized protein n=1 Tax=Stephania yunnanensis TaxID=152371 RepID=A0AAP0J7L7_9MAGN
MAAQTSSATAAVDQRDVEELTSSGVAPPRRTTQWERRVRRGGSGDSGKVWWLGVLTHKKNEVKGRYNKIYYLRALEEMCFAWICRKSVDHC